MRDEKPPPSVRDIAERAGVSKSTVAYALRNDPKIAEATRKKIWDIAVSMGYRPDPAVAALMASLRRKRSPVSREPIAYLYPSLKNLVYKLYIEGAEARAHELGYVLQPIQFRPSEMTGKRLTKILHARGIRGVVLAPLGFKRGGRLSLDWDQFAVAAIAYTLWRPAVPRVSNNQYESMGLAMRKAKKLGYTRIGMAMDDVVHSRSNGGWLACYEVQHIGWGRRYYVPPFLVPEEQWGRAAFLRWFNEHRPDVVISGASALSWLRDEGLDVPGDVGYITIDTDKDEPGCSGLDQNFRRVAAAAIDCVAAQLQRNELGIPVPPETTLIPSRWVEGGTVRRKRGD